ncbi:MAG: hypothetical protein K9I74_08065 [Bacteroidales bacterium]|nr:hypothetical protein [Bacteroidales bacterium]
MEKQKETKRFSLTEIILTAIITALLTSISSFFLTKSKLKQEQNYWQKRLVTERLVKIHDRQISLYEEINTGILETEALARELKLMASQYNVYASIATLGSDNYKNFKAFHNDFMEKKFEYIKYIHSFSGKIQLIPMYFTTRVDTLIEPLRVALQNNIAKQLSIGEKVELDSISEIYNNDYETIKELTDTRINILKTMNEDMHEVSKTLFNNEN